MDHLWKQSNYVFHALTHFISGLLEAPTWLRHIMAVGICWTSVGSSLENVVVCNQKHGKSTNIMLLLLGEVKEMQLEHNIPKTKSVTQH